MVKGLPHGRSSILVPQRSLIERPRLLQLLSSHGSDRLVIIRAPAGYGKTGLLQQWADHCTAEGELVVWLAIEPRDRDPMHFASHFNAALGDFGIAIDEPLQGVSGSLNFFGWQAIIQRLCYRLADAGRRCRVMLDDAHIAADSAMSDCLQILLADAPPEVQFVVATRGDAGFPLGRLRAQQEILELGADDLRFLPAETLSYVERQLHSHVASENVTLLQERSEGWIAGIKLFSMALSLEPENRKILESFSGERREIAEFFIEDVFSRQTPEIQDFLLRSSLLGNFCSRLCDAALEQRRSSDLIDQCERAGLFVQSLDNVRNWYRYHPLFADFLRRQLQDRMPDEANAIHRRAAHWHEAEKNPVEAFNCAMKGQDPLFAADILDAYCDAMFAAGLQSTVQILAAELPAHIRALYPRIMLTLAWRLLAQWRLPEARAIVAAVERRIDEMQRSSDSDPVVIRELQWLVAHRATQIAHTAYEVENLEAQCLSILENNPDFATRPYLQGSFLNSLQYAQREQFKLGRIDRFEAEAHEQVRSVGANQGAVFVAAITGPSLLLKGQTARARTVLRDGLDLAQDIAGRDHPLGSVVGTSLAAVHYECNEIPQARALIAQYLPNMTSAGLIDQLIHGWLTKARLHLLDGEVDACLETLETASEFGSRHQLDRLRSGANAEHLRVLLKLGRPDDASRFFRRRGLGNHRAASLTRSQFRYTVLDSEIAMANCRMMAADDRFGDALGLARQWRTFVTAAQAIYAAVQWDILVAELLLLSGERLAARRALQQAVTKAGPSRLVRRFLDEGEPIASMLRQMVETDGGQSPVGDPFVLELVSSLSPVEEQPLEISDEEDLAICGRITGREIEILAMAGQGMLNRQIGDRLGLTEGTVKWYLQQVYDKVGVRSRKLVVARVRRLGLIP